MSAAQPLRLVPPEPTREDTVEAMCRRACAMFDVNYDELFDRSRSKRHTKARTWVAQKLRGRHWSMSDIGELFNRDHSTVSYWLGKAKR